jgi:hypothetical protein
MGCAFLIVLTHYMGSCGNPNPEEILLKREDWLRVLGQAAGDSQALATGRPLSLRRSFTLH